MADTDWGSSLTGLVSMAASALAQEKKKQQAKSDIRGDTASDIAFQRAAELGSPGAEYLAEGERAKLKAHRLDRQSIDYGKGLDMLGRSAPGIAKSLGGNGTNASDNSIPDPSSLQDPTDNVNSPDFTLKLPAPDAGPGLGGTKVGLDTPTSLTAPDWDSLDLDDLDFG